MRVTGRRLIIAVPSGEAAEAHDRAMAAYFERRRGYRHEFFDDHLTNGLPSSGDVLEWVSAAAPDASIRSYWNSNLTLRRALMKMWARSGWLGNRVQMLLSLAHPLLRRASFGACYRFVVVATMPAASSRVPGGGDASAARGVDI